MDGAFNKLPLLCPSVFEGQPGRRASQTPLFFGLQQSRIFRHGLPDTFVTLPPGSPKSLFFLLALVPFFFLVDPATSKAYLVIRMTRRQSCLRKYAFFLRSRRFFVLDRFALFRVDPEIPNLPAFRPKRTFVSSVMRIVFVRYFFFFLGSFFKSSTSALRDFFFFLLPFCFFASQTIQFTTCLCFSVLFALLNQFAWGFFFSVPTGAFLLLVHFFIRTLSPPPQKAATNALRQTTQRWA